MLLLSRFKIKGHSMEPLLKDGSSVVVSYLPLIISNPKKGDIVVFEKFNRTYLKRISKADGKKYFLVGDNKKDSRDSRVFGSVDISQIKGKVILKI